MYALDVGIPTVYGNLPLTAVVAPFFYRHCLIIKAVVNQMVKPW